MAYESTAEPIKLGYLFDFRLPEYYPKEMRADLTQTFELVFDEGLKQRVIDRPVQIVFREVEAFRRERSRRSSTPTASSSTKVASRSSVPASPTTPCRRARRSAALPGSGGGQRDRLGRLARRVDLAFPMGSLTEEPIFWVDLLAKGGHTEVGVLVEQSLVGETYVESFRHACRGAGIRIVAEEQIAQTAQDVGVAVGKSARGAGRPRSSTAASASGSCTSMPCSRRSAGTRPASRAPRSNAWINPVLWNAFLGWTGIDQYDEANLVGQRFLDQYEAATGGARSTACPW